MSLSVVAAEPAHGSLVASIGGATVAGVAPPSLFVERHRHTIRSTPRHGRLCQRLRRDCRTDRRVYGITMFWFMVNIALDVVTGSGQKGLAAAEALEKPAISSAAQRYRTAAVILFLLTSAFLFSAAIAYTIAPHIVINEILGWTGIVCLHACVLCGLRYAVVNSAT